MGDVLDAVQRLNRGLARMRLAGIVAGVLVTACGARSGLDPSAGGPPASASGGSAGASARCGNALVDPNEECDDGNSVAADGCETNCTRTRIQSVVVGDSRTCVLTTGGDVRCWGANGNGAAGYGKGVCADPPIPCTDACCVGDDETPGSRGEIVDVGGTVTQLSAGATHTCALLDTGRVRCWGNGDSGRLGYGNTNDIGDDESPASAGDVDVGGKVVQVSVGGGIGAGAHTCALLVGGRVRCWGDDSVGALGYGNTDFIGDDESPASAGDVDVGGPVTQIATGDSFTCALLQGGSVRCWGFGRRGRLGYGNTENIGDDETPASVGDVDVGGRVVQLSAGSGRHVCALLETGRVRCWGYGAFGQLGHGNTENIGDDETPASAGDVPLPDPVQRLSAGQDSTCALLETGAVICWGSNYYGYLGIPSLRSGCFSCGPDCCLGDDELLASAAPIDVGGPVAQIAAGQFHVCALLVAGTVRCWGSGEYGALGYGNTDIIGDDEPPSAAGDVPVF